MGLGDEYDLEDVEGDESATDTYDDVLERHREANRSVAQWYIDHAAASLIDGTVATPDGPKHPSIGFLRTFESYLDGVEGSEKNVRMAVVNWVAKRARDGESTDPLEHDAVRGAARTYRAEHPRP